MTDFSRAILDYWHEAFKGRRVDTEGDFTLTVVPTLNRKRPSMILEGQDSSTRVALTPELAGSDHSHFTIPTAIFRRRARSLRDGVR